MDIWDFERRQAGGAGMAEGVWVMYRFGGGENDVMWLSMFVDGELRVR